MAMEAVKMMATTEPGRVGPYLEATRGNVEEGYAHIRQILRDFRSRERAQDTCYMAIKKLVNVFSLSTGLAVRFEFGNLDPALLDRFGECVYHFIQEGLINAFRHGRASKVTLLFWDFGEALRITLDDDGSGCAAAPVPGIGLNGMIERSTALEGKVAVERFTRGFRISMTLPKDVHAADD
jgi:signal transduction histidine kinase